MNYVYTDGVQADDNHDSDDIENLVQITPSGSSV